MKYEIFTAEGRICKTTSKRGAGFQNISPLSLLLCPSVEMRCFHALPLPGGVSALGRVPPCPAAASPCQRLCCRCVPARLRPCQVRVSPFIVSQPPGLPSAGALPWAGSTWSDRERVGKKRFSFTPKKRFHFPPHPGLTRQLGGFFSPKENARFPFQLPPSRVSSSAMSEAFPSSL